MIYTIILSASTLIFFLKGWGFALSSEETIAKRVYAHLQVHDEATAYDEARLGFERYPHSALLFEACIKALSENLDEKGLSAFWNQYAPHFPELQKKRDLLEKMAWSVIENGSHSSSPLIRITALLGAFFGNDARGVEILCVNMRDQNSLIRSVAVKLAGSLRDAKLQDEILHLLKHDKNWEVRLKALKTAGEMKILEAKPYMMEIISSDLSMAEEKSTAIEALVHMLEDVERPEIARLAASDRAGLRLLACHVVDHLDRTADIDLIMPLLNDYHAEVRAEALKTIGLLRIPSVKEVLRSHLNDLDPYAAIAAAWSLTLNEPEQGLKALEPWLSDKTRDIRLAAASALAATGKYGVPLMQKVFRVSSDPYVRMNIALGLIGQRVDSEAACQALYEGLSCIERWMWREDKLFKTLAPSEIKYDEMIPNYPESVNQLVRLEVLNILAIMKYPHAQTAIRTFLKEKTWGITGMASALLLTEGDEAAMDLVEELLRDPDQKIRLQAALVLSMWGQKEEAISILKAAYPEADRETKERILESFGRIKTPCIVPFLTEKMQESYQSLRILAAAALLQCLYN